MKKIYLTFDLDADDSSFVHLDAQKIPAHVVLSNVLYDPLKHKTSDRIRLIATEIIRSNGDILVGQAGFSASEFAAIESRLLANGLHLNTIFVPGESRQKQRLKEGHELYANHNRWLNYYPGEIDDIHGAWVNNINGIVKAFPLITKQV